MSCLWEPTPPAAHNQTEAVSTPALAPSPSCSNNPLPQTRHSIPVSHIRAVERVDEGAFQLPHVMQVVTQDGAGALHTTYLQCKVRPRRDGERVGVGRPLVPTRPLIASHPLQNVNELNQWLSALRKASAPNPDKLAACHPGAFRSARWTCCLQAERSGEGAARTAGSAGPTRQSVGVPLPPGLAVQPWASYSTSLCLSLLNCEIRLITVPFSWSCDN